MNPLAEPQIHPTAVVSPEAELGPGVRVGPYAIVGSHLKIGAGTVIGSHAVLEGHTEIGDHCEIYPGACLGTPAQDKKSKGKTGFLRIGNDNIFREYVTVNCGSADTKTVIGDRNYLMIASHVGHDSTVGDDVTIANGSALGGHVTVEDKAVIGGLSAVHQFCRVGRFAMVGGMCRIVMDVPPFSLCNGNPARLYGINAVGLKRAGYTSENILLIKKALKMISGRGKNLSALLGELDRAFGTHADIQHLKTFIQASKRGYMRGSLRSGEREA